MIQTLEHWFTMNEVPINQRTLLERMSELLGYKTMRKDEDGRTVTSNMFMMQCKAAEVSELYISMAKQNHNVIFNRLFTQ